MTPSVPVNLCVSIFSVSGAICSAPYIVRTVAGPSRQCALLHLKSCVLYDRHKGRRERAQEGKGFGSRSLAPSATMATDGRLCKKMHSCHDHKWVNPRRTLCVIDAYSWFYSACSPSGRVRHCLP